MNPIRVKCVGRVDIEKSATIWSRQIKGGHHVGGCDFIFDFSEKRYDWLVVYDDMPRYSHERRRYLSEDLSCPTTHTILVTSEPSSVRRYPRLFLEQFNFIVSSQEPEFIAHPGHILIQGGLRWYYGLGKQHALTLDDMVAHPPLEKSADISAIVSSKRQSHTLHAKRVDFIKSIQSFVPKLERFGHGVRAMDDKAEALDSFRYHIAIENHLAPHHWTEKLSDAFLACTLPFYIGAPNVFDYFPRDSLIPLQIDDPQGSAKIINEAIANQEWEKRLPLILEARNRVIERYGLFQNLASIIGGLSAAPLQTHHLNRSGQIKSAHDARRIRPLYSFFERLRYSMRFMPLGS